MDGRATQINPLASASDGLSLGADAVMPPQFYPARRGSALEIDPRRLRDLIVRWEKDRRCDDKQPVRRSSVEVAGLIQSVRGSIHPSSETTQ